MSKRFAALSLVFGLALLATGCADPQPEDGPEVATFEEANLSGEMTVRAVFVGVSLGGVAATVEHEEIPGVMPPMRMDVALDPPALVDGLAPGDKVLLTLVERDSGPGFIVTGVTPLPADTELDLEGAGADSAFVPGA